MRKCARATPGLKVQWLPNLSAGNHASKEAFASKMPNVVNACVILHVCVLACLDEDVDVRAEWRRT